MAVIDPQSSLRVNFERGVDRIFDLELLPQMPPDAMFDSQITDDNIVIKKVELNLEWEIFSVKFTVSHPLGNNQGQMILMGNHDETKNIFMKKNPIMIPWMSVKYGDDSDPWEYTVKFPNIEGGIDG